MKSFLIVILIFSWGVSKADEVPVLQVGKSFIHYMKDGEIEKLKNSRGKFKSRKVKKVKMKEITIKQGDTIAFYNKDNVVHNVFGKGFDFKQDVGSVNKQKFTKKGTRTIRCAIHPKMKLKVHVK